MLLLMQPLLLPRVTAAVDAAGGCAKHGVMAGIVTGNPADHRALQAAPGVGGFGPSASAATASKAAIVFMAAILCDGLSINRGQAIRFHHGFAPPRR